ncbi:MAG: hypothetical protein M3Z57_04380 [Candidatus Dormibacteraeota bacterium]|nr:hypothetical protein [Candidatus Dormibacteraeota bacterium]
MRRLLLCGLGALLVGCGSGAVTPSPTVARPTATPAPTPTPAPDVQRIDVVSTGVGTWQLVAVPVAVIHNVATHTGVSGVIVHFTLMRGTKALNALESPQLTLYPGQTLVVTSYQCTDYPCYTADSVAVTVSPGTWAALPGAPLTATGAAFKCTKSCTGHGQWDVPIMVGGPHLLANEQVDIFASCSNAAGAIIGGGSRELLWPQPGGSLNLAVPVIVNSAPASCQVGATTSN